MYDNITASFIGTGLSLFGAGILWIVKLSYDRHKNTKLACAKLERALILNIAALGENTKLIEQWIISLQQEKRFTCYFSKFNTESSDLLFINELPLVNRLIKTNYVFTSIGEDIESIEKDYKEMWSALYESKINEPTIKVYMQTLLPQIEPLPEKMKEIQIDIIADLAHLQRFCKCRKYTLFGLRDYMHVDLFP